MTNNKQLYFDDASICRQQGMQYRNQQVEKETVKEMLVKLFPNPTNEILNIAFESLPDNAVQIHITNLLGQTMHVKTHAAAVTLSISMSEMQTKPGLYLIRVSTSDDLINFNSKFIYEK